TLPTVRRLQFGAFLTALPNRRYARHTSEDLPAWPVGGQRDAVSPAPASESRRGDILRRMWRASGQCAPCSLIQSQGGGTCVPRIRGSASSSRSLQRLCSSPA